MSQEKQKENLLGVAKELLGRLVWSHKIHEKQGEILAAKDHRVKGWNVALVALTAISAVIGSFYMCQAINIATALLGAASTSFLIYQLTFAYESKASEHRVAAKHLMALRDRTVFLIEEILAGRSNYPNLRHTLKEIRIEVTKVFELAPDTTPEAEALAKIALEGKEDFSKLDTGADKFLPKTLQKKRHAPNTPKQP